MCLGEWLNGRVAVSKTVGCVFESRLPCQTLQITTSCGLKRFLFKLQRKQFPFIPADFGVVCRPPKFSLRLCAGIRSYRPFFFILYQSGKKVKR